MTTETVNPRPYSTRRAANASGLSEKQVRSHVHADVVRPERGPRGAFRFSFQDVAVLRTSRRLLDEGIPARRVRRTLSDARAAVSQRGIGLSSLGLEPVAGRIAARDPHGAWLVATGQGLLDLDLPPEVDHAIQIGHNVVPAGAQAASEGPKLRVLSGHEHTSTDPDDWFNQAVDLESHDPLGARAAYREAIATDPGHTGALANLGRLLHEQGDLAEAEIHYRAALEAGLGDGTAAYNLGVVLEDLGRLDEAIEAYVLALQANGGFLEAHFNLARIHESRGDRARALGHLVEYRRLKDLFSRAD